MDTASLWQAVLGEIELSVSKGNYVTWFKNTRLVQADEKRAVVGTPNVFIKYQLEKRFNDLILEKLQKNGVNPQEVEYKIVQTSTINKRERDAPVFINQQQKARPQATQSVSSSLTHSYRRGLNDKYSFENFIVGSGNELAYAACQAVATNPGSKYNPFFCTEA